MRFQVLLITLAFTALAAHGEPVYRSVMPDGRIIYGDKPAPGAKEAKEVTLSKPNIIAPVSTKPPAAKPAPNAKPGDSGAGPDAVRIAQEKLDAAKAALEAGREQKEGDRTGTARKGASQLNDNYYKRVKELEDAVTAAQKQLDDARR